MNTAIVRLQSIAIENLQNVKKGEISFACSKNDNIFALNADVLGLYGQNGSGKTTFIHAIDILQRMLSGQSLNNDEFSYITYGKDSAKLKFEISIQVDAKFYMVVYEVVVGKKPKSNDIGLDTTEKIAVTLLREKLKYKQWVDNKWTRLNVLLNVDFLSQDLLLPAKNIDLLIGDKHELVNELKVQKLLSYRQASSFIFSRDVQILLRFNLTNCLILQILNMLHGFGVNNLFVIETRGWGPINMNLALPFYFRVQKANQIVQGSIPINLNGPTPLDNKASNVINDAIEELNFVLDKIIPGLQIKFVKLGKQLLANGQEGTLVEIISIRGKQNIPLRYESEGIKKIIAILQMLIVTFNNPTMTLAVDELDSGVFEYLLGEILRIFYEHGRGQLIFTSHNLRPLETLHKSSIVFTTTNKNNRYLRLANIKTNNNLRDTYYHDIVLGGQKEELYDKTNNYEIAYALRKAGEIEQCPVKK